MNIYPDGSLCVKRDPRQRVVFSPFDRLRIVTVVEGESVTTQDAKDSADINSIIARFSRTGVLPTTKGTGIYADVTGLQGGDTASMIVKSRETVSSTRSFLLTRAEKRQADIEAKQAADLAELAALRLAKINAIPPGPTPAS